MVALPPPINGFLFYNNQWNDVTGFMRQTEQIDITRGMTSEGQQADPSEGSILMDNRTGRFSAKNPNSPLFGLIGRNTPMRLSMDLGTPWMELPATSDNSQASTPDNAALDIVGDIDIRLDCRLKNWNPGVTMTLASKTQSSITGNQISWYLLQTSTSRLQLTWSIDGTGAGGKTATSTIEIPALSGNRITLRATVDVNNGLGGYTVWFYTAPGISGPWTPLGDPTITTAGVTSIFNSTSSVQVGSATGLAFRNPVGKFYAFQLRNGIDGTLVADADFTDRDPGDTSWVDSTGRTWTLNASASISNTHVRLVGEVPAWPPRRNLTSSDKRSPIKPTGIFRRLSSGSKPLKSASYRAIILNPDSDLLAYWPCEDEANAISIAAATANTQPMAITVAGATLHADSSFQASDALPKMGLGRFNASVPSYTFGTSSQLRFFMKIPSTPPTSGALIATFTSTGSVAEYRLQYFATGALRFSAYNAVGTLVGDSFNVAFNPQGKAVRFHLGITQSGADISYTMAMLEQGASSGTGFVSTFLALTAGPITGVSFGDPALGLGDTVIGQVSVNSANGSLFDQSEQLSGWFAEPGKSRIARLCDEEGIYREVAGFAFHGVQLGVQGIDNLVTLLSESAEADQGLLFDTRDAIGVRYRALDSLQNQTPIFTLDFSQGLISAPFEPIDDDKLTENSVVVKVRGGSSSAPAVLTTGEMSIQDPPDGVGLYDISKEYSLNNANTAGWVAGWRLNRGTFNGLRYTSITVDLANPRVFAMRTEILEADVGDLIRLTNLPSDLPPDDVDLLVIGYSETIGPRAWQMTFVCVPGEPFETGILQGTQLSDKYATNMNNRADLTGSTLLDDLDTDDVDMDVIQATDSYTPWNHAYRVINSNINLASGTTGWQASGGTLAVVAPPAGQLFEGDSVLQFIPNGVTNPGSVESVHSAVGTVTSTLSYYVQGWIYSNVDLPDVKASAHWYDAADVFLSTFIGTTQVVPKNTWTYIFGTGVAPANASRTQARIRIGSAAPANALIYIGNLRIRRDRTGFFPDEFPVDLRVAGEVVRATSCMPYIHDTFSRDTASAWGTAESQQAWGTAGGTAADFSTNKAAAEGRHTLATANANRRSFIEVFHPDNDAQAFVSTGALATGGSQFASVTGRHIDGSNLYLARLEFKTDNRIDLSIRKIVAGVETQLANIYTGLTHVANTKYGIRFYIRGTTLKAKAWLASVPQGNEAAWDLTVTDSSIATADFWGLYSIRAAANTNANLVVAYSQVRQNYPQRFTVERSINGVVKSLATGDDVNVERPMITQIR